MDKGTDFEQERRRLTAQAWWMTGSYCVALLLLALMVVFWGKGPCAFLKMKPNEIGDLLAGIAGPLAFIWLVYGYRLQGIAIGQQADQLALTTEALRIQVMEMERLKKRRSREIEPNFRLRFAGEKSREQGRREIEIEITNFGGIARKVQLEFSGSAGIDNPSRISKIDKGQKKSVNIMFNENSMQNIKFIIKYCDQDGNDGENPFEMEVQRVNSQYMTGIAFHAVLD